MKETHFIEQNKEKWRDFEGLSKAKKKDPDKLSDLFVQITDDLSYSRTYYPNRLVRAYLNNLAQKIYLRLYKNRRRTFEKAQFFFTEDLPFILYEARKELLISLFIFSFAAIIGIVSCINDPDYAEVVTSKYYVEMTKNNIEKGDPMAVYKDKEQFNMFLRIGWNNLRVAFYTFALGITACIGTIFILLNNGTMLGGFQFFFYNQGILGESALTIWQHGTIEILCIIIAGGAGIVMGKGLVFPGTYPRLQALRISAKKGLKIMLAITPLIVLAALIEAYITRLTEAPFVFRIGVILLSLGVMFGYFVYYPWRKSRSGFHSSLRFEKPRPDKALRLRTNVIKSIGDVFAESFTLHTQNLKYYLPIGIIAGVLFGIAHVHYHEETIFVWDHDELIDVIGAMLEYVFLSFFSFFKFADKPLIAVLNVLLMATIMTMASVTIKPLKAESKWKQLGRRLIVSVLFAVILNSVFLLDSGWMYLLFLLAIPVVSFPVAALNTDDLKLTQGLIAGPRNMLTGLFSSFLLLIMLFIIFLMFMLLSGSALVSMVVDLVRSNFLMDAETMELFTVFTSAFLSILVFSLAFPIFFEAFYLWYHSLKEAKEASNLRERIKAFDSF